MRNFLKILFIILPFALNAQSGQNINPNGYNKFYYDSGVLSSEGTMRDGKPDGYWKTYSPNGKIKSEGNRKNFELDSVWKFYNEQGKLAFEFNYLKGKKKGYKKTYDTKDGSLVTSENYVNDVKSGNTIVYYKDGRVKQTIPFSEGKEEGLGYEYAPDSTIISLTQYKMGFIQKDRKINRRDAKGLKQGTWIEFHPNGQVKTEVTYSDDKMNGYLKEYSASGSLLNTTKYVNGAIITNAPELAKLDVQTGYYEGGAVKFTGTYKDGVAEGIHREFSPEGKVTNAKVYVEGVLTGEGILDTIGRMQGMWREYHPNGELKSKGEYINSKRVGEWVFFHPNGKEEQKGKYDKKGKAQGPWRWYYESGNILREENYRNDLQDGTMTEYSEDGKVITKGDYVDGLKEGPWMLQLADYREEGEYKADRRDGEWKHYYTDTDKLRFVGKFVDGVPDGLQTYYYRDGKEKQKGKYLGGMKEGEWYFYDESGFLFLTILFKNDVEVRFDGIKVVPETPTSEPSIK
jgi:antitoxin component YwqK of YwqJK toxin-antitoxin module